MCEVLLRSGAETFYKDKLGRTILHIGAINKCDVKLFTLIMDYKKY